MKKTFLLLLLIPVLAAPVAAKKLEREIPPEMPEAYRTWLEEVDVLVSDDEWRHFVALTKDHQRDLFIRRFWDSRDPDPDSGRNEFRETFELRLDLVREEIGDVTDQRARVLLVNGSPSDRAEIFCPGYTRPIEGWFYPNGIERRRTGFALLFFRPGDGTPWRLWEPPRANVSELLDDGLGTERAGAIDDLSELDLSQAPPDCADDLRGLRTAIAAIRSLRNDYQDLVSAVLQPLRPRSTEWLATLETYSTDLPDAAATFPSELEVGFPGWRGQQTIVQGLVKVPAAEVTAFELENTRTYSLTLNGEVLKEREGESAELHDGFRMRFDLPAGDVGDVLPLVFERSLRPGEYRLVLRLEDVNSRKLARHEMVLVVPKLEGPPAFAADMDPEVRRVLDAAYKAVAAGETSLEIVRPRGEYLTGLQRFDTLAIGPGIHEVVFRLDGRDHLRKKAPPWSVEIYLGPLPEAHTLTAVAFSEDGTELASDELVLNGSPHRFAVRLIEPVANKRYENGLRARVEVTVPRGSAVESVELYRGDERVATLYQPPYTQPIALPGAGLVLVRAVARLHDGTTAEDVVLVNSPAPVEEIDVDLVELYTSVVDGRQRPVLGLMAEDFTVFEDGDEQELVRFEKVDDLPIHAVILLDVSASMNERLPAARSAALDFFEDIVEPRDRLAAITFNDRPAVAVDFTSELERFAEGMAGLRAERGTALYDSLIYALFYSNALEGQRAVLLLSDGVDESSRFSDTQALEYLKRAGVTIYAIGLDLTGLGKRTLKQFSDETGGRSFFLDDMAELPAVYDTIREELRTRYLLAYQSTNTRPRVFRQVEVVMGLKGLEARAIRGYYP